MLNFASIKGNNNKYYQIELFEESAGGYYVLISYGRVGANPQIRKTSWGTLTAAENCFSKKLKEKLNKGYVAVELRVDAPNTPVDAGAIDSVDEEDSVFTGELQKVYSMLKNFTKDAQSHISKNVDSPLGALSDNQIDKATLVLDSIEHNLLHKTSFDIYTASDEFYRLIPIRFGRKNPDALLINTLKKTVDYRALLDVMRSVVISGVGTPMEDVYKNLGFSLKPLDTTEEDFLYISNYVENTQSKHHSFKINIQNIFKVDNDEWDKKFNPANLETQYLFHGSRAENFMKIFQSGLRIKPSGIHHTGSMFGNGIYFADQSSKSANYTWNFSRHSTKKGEKFYMLVCEVATGKMKDYESAQSSLVKAPDGYDSVRGVKGSHLLHNEIIVYNENQSNIKYVIEFTAA